MTTSLAGQAGFFDDGRVRFGVDDTTHAFVPNPIDTGLLDLGATDAQWKLIHTSLGFPTGTSILTSTKGATWKPFFVEEEITLATDAATTDSTANLLPANSIILFVGAYVTTTIATCTNWALGDSAVAARFLVATTDLTAGTSKAGFSQMFGVVSATNAGPTQAAAAKLRVTTTGSQTTAGKVRVCVMGWTFSAPTS